ncbi:MAG: PAS domain-containing sensor histidine kinase [Deltaproteobacteria bacterium]|nr:PAS domain-containing sensor histidine kinase [Deltaproteobacteria bacterium]
MKSGEGLGGGDLGDLLPYGLVVVDAQGTMVQLNEQLASMFGFERNELLGEPVERLMPEGRRNAHVLHRCDFAHTPSARNMGDISLTGYGHDGHEFPIHVDLQPLANGGTLAIVADLREASHQALTRVARANRDAMTTTFGAIAHELNNPLSCMLPSLQVAIDMSRGKQPQLQAALEDCLEATRRIGAIVSDMATLGGSRCLEGGTPLLEIAQATARLIEARAPEHLNVRAEAKGDPRVACPSVNVGQILLNLCLNALHAMVEAECTGEIVLEVSEEGGFGVLDVHDHGPGVPADLRERIFAPFFTTRAAGSGVGLALSREKATLLGGDLQLAHSDERGSVFRLTLPLASG